MKPILKVMSLVMFALIALAALVAHPVPPVERGVPSAVARTPQTDDFPRFRRV